MDSIFVLSFFVCCLKCFPRSVKIFFANSQHVSIGTKLDKLPLFLSCCVQHRYTKHRSIRYDVQTYGVWKWKLIPRNEYLILIYPPSKTNISFACFLMNEKLSNNFLSWCRTNVHKHAIGKKCGFTSRSTIFSLGSGKVMQTEMIFHH